MSTRPAPSERRRRRPRAMPITSPVTSAATPGEAPGFQRMAIAAVIHGDRQASGQGHQRRPAPRPVDAHVVTS